MTRQEALDFLTRQAKGLAETFGECCETVVQEVVGKDMVVRAIFNGHVSGREVGSKVGILGGTLDTSKMDIQDIACDDVNQLVLHPSGKKIKSSDFVLSGEGYIFALGINYDVTLLEQLQTLMGQFLSYNGDLYDTLSKSAGRSQNEIFDSVAKSYPEIQGKISKHRRLKMIEQLDRLNFFDLQKSVPFLAEKLKVSKYTLYKDMSELGIK